MRGGWYVAQEASRRRRSKPPTDHQVAIANSKRKERQQQQQQQYFPPSLPPLPTGWKAQEGALRRQELLVPRPAIWTDPTVQQILDHGSAVLQQEAEQPRLIPPQLCRAEAPAEQQQQRRQDAEQPRLIPPQLCPALDRNGAEAPAEQQQQQQQQRQHDRTYTAPPHTAPPQQQHNRTHTAPPPQQHAAPPQQQQQQQQKQQYSAPPPQQHAAPPRQQQKQQYSAPPPQQHATPPQQHAAPPQQQQHSAHPQQPPKVPPESLAPSRSMPVSKPAPLRLQQTFIFDFGRPRRQRLKVYPKPKPRVLEQRRVSFCLSQNTIRTFVLTEEEVQIKKQALRDVVASQRRQVSFCLAQNTIHTFVETEEEVQIKKQALRDVVLSQQVGTERRKVRLFIALLLFSLVFAAAATWSALIEPSSRSHTSVSSAGTSDAAQQQQFRLSPGAPDPAPPRHSPSPTPPAKHLLFSTKLQEQYYNASNGSGTEMWLVQVNNSNSLEHEDDDELPLRLFAVGVNDWKLDPVQRSMQAPQERCAVIEDYLAATANGMAGVTTTPMDDLLQQLTVLAQTVTPIHQYSNKVSELVNGSSGKDESLPPLAPRLHHVKSFSSSDDDDNNIPALIGRDHDAYESTTGDDDSIRPLLPRGVDRESSNSTDSSLPELVLRRDMGANSSSRRGRDNDDELRCPHNDDDELRCPHSADVEIDVRSGTNSKFAFLFDDLMVLQHCEQDAASIVTADQRRLHLRKDNGLFNDVSQAHGAVGFGVRYSMSSTSTSSRAEAQPLYTSCPYGVCMAHNGNITNADELAVKAHSMDRHVSNDSDTSEPILNLFAEALTKQAEAVNASSSSSLLAPWSCRSPAVDSKWMRSCEYIHQLFHTRLVELKNVFNLTFVPKVFQSASSLPTRWYKHSQKLLTPSLIEFKNIIVMVSQYNFPRPRLTVFEKVLDLITPKLRLIAFKEVFDLITPSLHLDAYICKFWWCKLSHSCSTTRLIGFQKIFDLIPNARSFRLDAYTCKRPPPTRWALFYLSLTSPSRLPKLQSIFGGFDVPVPQLQGFSKKLTRLRKLFHLSPKSPSRLLKLQSIFRCFDVPVFQLQGFSKKRTRWQELFHLSTTSPSRLPQLKGMFDVFEVPIFQLRGSSRKRTPRMQWRDFLHLSKNLSKNICATWTALFDAPIVQLRGSSKKELSKRWPHFCNASWELFHLLPTLPRFPDSKNVFGAQVLDRAMQWAMWPELFQFSPASRSLESRNVIDWSGLVSLLTLDRTTNDYAREPWILLQHILLAFVITLFAALGFVLKNPLQRLGRPGIRLLHALFAALEFELEYLRHALFAGRRLERPGRRHVAGQFLNERPLRQALIAAFRFDGEHRGRRPSVRLRLGPPSSRW